MSRLFEISIPRNDLRKHPEAVKRAPPPVGAETSLHQCTKSKVLQWSTRTKVYWYPYGEPFWIDEEEECES